MGGCGSWHDPPPWVLAVMPWGTQHALGHRTKQAMRFLNSGNPAGFERFFGYVETSARYQYVLRVCRRFFRQPEDAEDAAAEVFLKLYRVLHQRDETMPFRPWVSRVAGRHCIDKLRQKNASEVPPWRTSTSAASPIGAFTAL